MTHELFQKLVEGFLLLVVVFTLFGVSRLIDSMTGKESNVEQDT